MARMGSLDGCQNHHDKLDEPVEGQKDENSEEENDTTPKEAEKEEPNKILCVVGAKDDRQTRVDSSEKKPRGTQMEVGMRSYLRDVI